MIKLTDLTIAVMEYYRERNLKLPETIEALTWLNTEVAEAQEIEMAFRGGWVRNNNHPVPTLLDFSLECGDVIMMALVACYVAGAPNPIVSMLRKMCTKEDGFADFLREALECPAEYTERLP
jgi:hypothetical protein